MGGSQKVDVTDPPEELGSPLPLINDREAWIVVGVCGLICFCILAFDVWYYITTNTLHTRYNTPNKSLLKLLDDKKNVIDGVTLHQRVKEVLSMVPIEAFPDPDHNHNRNRNRNHDERIQAFLRGIIDGQANNDRLEKVKGSRDNCQLPIRKENRLRLEKRTPELHVSELVDLYGNPMFLSAAPLPHQFACHWEAIWEKEIGVVVWIGRLATTASCPRMDAYIPLQEGVSVQYGQFRIETIESGDLRYKFALYLVQVSRGWKKREVVFIHAYEWLQESVSWALRRDVELIMCLKDEHVRRSRDYGLRSVMFQDKFGTAGSCTMLTVYIGYQFWMNSGKANFYGILQYIRRMRAMAFQMTGSQHHTMHTQIRIAYSVFYGVAKFCQSQKIPLYEPWIKKLLSRSYSKGKGVETDDR